MNHKKLLLTLTLCLCALLCMVVTASASDPHRHLICEGTTCTDPAHASHSDVTFEKAITTADNVLCIDGVKQTPNSNSSDNYEYTLSEGTYYLDDNLTLNKGIQVQGNVTLCLNGHEIRSEGSYVIQTPWSGTVTFTLCDCKAGGKIAHTVNSSSNSAGVNFNNTSTSQQTFIMYNGCITQNKGSGVYLYQNTSFTMYGGSITQNGYNNTSQWGVSGGGVCVHSEATFTMYGGNITGNYANKNGGGVHVGSETANFTMYGGSITGNHTAGSGGGVNVNAGTMIVRGDINISGNWKGDAQSSASNNNANNVYLPANSTITIEKALTGEPIGITTANAPTAGNPVTIVTGNSIKEAYKDSFQADNAAYGVSYNSTDKVLQLHKHSGGTATCMAEASCETCGQRYGNRNPNNHDYSQTRMTPTYKASDATCTTPVTYYYSCVCGAKGTNTFDSTKEDEQAKGHAFAAAWEHNDDKHWHKCTRDGCTGIDAEAAHEWQPATYTAPKTCVCGATQGEPLTRSYYYYAPSAAENKKDSPKTADPGVLLYAGLALASLTGLACTAKKRH